MSKLLVISSIPTHPTNAGNRARVRKWLELCLETGVDFHFAFFRHEAADESAMAEAWGAERCTFLNYKKPSRSFNLPQRLRIRAARVMGKAETVPYAIDDWRCEALVKDVTHLARKIKPTCVQIQYVFFSHLFECFEPSVFKILDTQDVMAERDRGFLKQGRRPEWFYTTKRQEAIGVSRADCVVAIQEEESSYFRGLTKKSVATVGHIVDLRRPAPPSTSHPVAVFIGSGNSINQDALDFLLKKIWPSIKASVPNAVLEVYGDVCASAKGNLKGVRLAGQISDLSQAYERAWVVLCPLRFGTGLKIKSIEALGQGKALVSTTEGCVGMEDGIDTALLRGDSHELFAEHCKNVLADSALRQRLENAAHEYACSWNRAQRAAFLSVLAAARLVRPEAETSAGRESFSKSRPSLQRAHAEI